jgi:hypothetical protein
VKISLPVFKAYRNNALELVQSLIQTGELVGGRYLSTSVRYIRGDYLREPEYEFITRRPIIGIDETVEVDVVIRNRSGAVSLAGGTVALDTSTLAPVLFPLGSTTQTFGSIIPNGSRTVTFSFQGFSLGKVNLQATVNGDWSAPVPPQRDFGGPVSLPGGIEVSTTPPPPPPLFSDGFED